MNEGERDMRRFNDSLSKTELAWYAGVWIGLLIYVFTDERWRELLWRAWWP